MPSQTTKFQPQSREYKFEFYLTKINMNTFAVKVYSVASRWVKPHKSLSLQSCQNHESHRLQSLFSTFQVYNGSSPKNDQDQVRLLGVK